MATPLADVMHEQKIDRPTTSKRSTYTDDRVVQKIDTLFVRLNQGTEQVYISLVLTLPNINRFSKLFQCQNQEEICNKILTKDPTSPQVCRYTTL